jgi:beta-glucosidase
LNPASPLDRWAAGMQDRMFNGLVLEFPASGKLLFPLSLGGKVAEAADSQDYIGLNYYSRSMVSFDLSRPAELFGRRSVKEGAEFSMEGWGEMYPEGLYRLLKRLNGYGKPIYVTETGIPDNEDAQRPRYLLTHLAAVHKAISEGVPVKGLYFWSLVDNFEWAEGFRARFGLIGLDLATGKRTLKRSGQLYGEIAKAGAITAEIVQHYTPEAINLILA